MPACHSWCFGSTHPAIPYTCTTAFLLWALQVVPILRAGLILLEQTTMLLPVTQTYHVGYVRNDDTLEVRYRDDHLGAELVARNGVDSGLEWNWGEVGRLVGRLNTLSLCLPA
jgi:hypothetical protein